MVKGILGDMFDFNRDGEMSIFERVAELEFIEDMEKEDTDDYSDDEEDELDSDDYDFD